MEITLSDGIGVEDRIVLARAVVNLMDQWKITGEGQVRLLGLPEGTPTRALSRYHDKEPLPDDKEILTRVEFLLAIAEALRTTYPLNPNMGAQWMNRRNRRFRRRTPLAVMIEDGMFGIMTVRAELDCTYAWDQTGSKR